MLSYAKPLMGYIYNTLEYDDFLSADRINILRLKIIKDLVKTSTGSQSNIQASIAHSSKTYLYPSPLNNTNINQQLHSMQQNCTSHQFPSTFRMSIHEMMENNLKLFTKRPRHQAPSCWATRRRRLLPGLVFWLLMGTSTPLSMAAGSKGGQGQGHGQNRAPNSS